MIRIRPNFKAVQIMCLTFLALFLETNEKQSTSIVLKDVIARTYRIIYEFEPFPTPNIFEFMRKIIIADVVCCHFVDWKHFTNHSYSNWKLFFREWFPSARVEWVSQVRDEKDTNFEFEEKTLAGWKSTLVFNYKSKV